MVERRGSAGGDPVATMPHIDRPRLRRILDDARRRQICVVVGAAGWGKSTAVTMSAQDRRTRWVDCDDLDPSVFVGELVRAVEPQGPSRSDLPAPEPPGGACSVAAMRAACGRLQHALRDELVLVIENLQEVPPGSELARVVELLCRHVPDGLHLVLVSRRELPFSLARPRGRGLVADVDATHLAFGVTEIDDLLRSTIGAGPPDLAQRVWERTSGWPAAVLGAVDLLRGIDPAGRSEVLGRLSRPGERFHTYLDEEVLAHEPEEVRDLLRRLAVCGESGLPAAAGSTGEDPAGALADLTRRGLVVRSAGSEAVPSPAAPLADYIEHDPTLTASDRTLLHITVAHECASRKAYAESLRHLIAGGAHTAAATLLIDHGTELVSSGRADAVLESGRLPARYLENPRIQQVLGHALGVRGQWAEAMDSFRRAGDTGELDPALAWRSGMLAFGQGELREVLALCRRARHGIPPTAADVQVRTLAATALRATGDLDTARTEIALAQEAAVRAGLDASSADRSGDGVGARCALRHGRAMLAAAEGDRRRADGHWVDALDLARSAGEVLAETWMHTCRADYLVDVGAPRMALEDAQVAMRLAERCGVPFLTACALTARGRAWTRLGTLDAAHGSFRGAIGILQDLGSRSLSWPLCGLGDLHRARNQPARARAAYEQALALSEPVGEVLGTCAALTGLARVRAVDDLDVAASLADRAVVIANGRSETGAVLARGWVALLRGDREAAARDAARADAVARGHRNGPALAEAITLAVLSAADPTAQVGLLGEAIEMYRESGCRLEEAAVRVVAARMVSGPSAVVRGAGGPGIDIADPAEPILRDAGVDVGAGWAAGPLAVSARFAPLLSIRALGTFQVIREGIPVPRTSWQSKKARDLVKILVARRRPVPRERLIEMLWPDADPAKAGNRLSVLLSMVRDVLASPPAVGDPVVTDGGAIGLNLACVHVDVEEFLAAAEVALAAHRSGRPDATARLAAAAAGYTGEFLEDDPYPDWAPPLAEELRATHIALLQALAVELRRADDVDGVVRCTLRLLGQDPYDEVAHLALVDVLTEAGRLGEARRHYRNYVRRMAEIGVPPRPVPAGARRGPRLRIQPRVDDLGS